MMPVHTEESEQLTYLWNGMQKKCFAYFLHTYLCISPSHFYLFLFCSRINYTYSSLASRSSFHFFVLWLEKKLWIFTLLNQNKLNGCMEGRNNANFSRMLNFYIFFSLNLYFHTTTCTFFFAYLLTTCS